MMLKQIENSLDNQLMSLYILSAGELLLYYFAL